MSGTVVLRRAYLTVISSSQRVVGRRESFCRFMCHDRAPNPWAADNTFSKRCRIDRTRKRK